MSAKDKKMINRNVLTAMGFKIPVKVFGNTDYLNASEMAKYRPEGKPSVEKYSVKNMLREFLSNKTTFDYVLEWEYMHNFNFKGGEFTPFSEVKQGRGNAIRVTPTALAEMGSGLVKVERGKYGAVWFHRNLALEFARYIDPKFAIYLTEDYQRLKLDELDKHPLSDEFWEDIRKEVKRIHVELVDAVRCRVHFDNPEKNEPMTKKIIAAEVDMINLIVFDKTAQQWRDENPFLEGNMRDYATVDQLQLVSYLEQVDAIYNQTMQYREMREDMLAEAAAKFIERGNTAPEDVLVFCRPANDPCLDRLTQNFRKGLEEGTIVKGDDGKYYTSDGHPVLLVPKDATT